MRYIETCACFELDTLDRSFLADLITHHLGFEPRHIDTNDFLRRGGRFRPSKHLDMIRTSKRLESLHIEGHRSDNLEGPTFDMAMLMNNGYEAIYWHLPGAFPPIELIDAMTGRPGFNAAYIGDSEDITWQSMEFIGNFEMCGIPHEHLPKVMDEDFGELRIDILHNPGARYPIYGGWLQASWRMWFGGRMFEYMPKERLLAFPHAERVEELATGAVFIELYKDPSAFDAPETRRRQHLFRDWTGIPDLARRSDEIRAGRGDYVYLFETDEAVETGVFPHGGVRRVTTWLDEAGEPVRKSRASQKIVYELGPDGHIVWSRQMGRDEPPDAD